VLYYSDSFDAYALLTLQVLSPPIYPPVHVRLLLANTDLAMNDIDTFGLPPDMDSAISPPATAAVFITPVSSLVRALGRPNESLSLARIAQNMFVNNASDMPRVYPGTIAAICHECADRKIAMIAQPPLEEFRDFTVLLQLQLRRLDRVDCKHGVSGSTVRMNGRSYA
jgi:hypothetical protein